MYRIVIGDQLRRSTSGEGRLVDAPGAVAYVAPPADVLHGDADRTVAAHLARAGWERADCYLQWAAERHPLPTDALEATPRLAVLFGDPDAAGYMVDLLAGVVDVGLADRAGVPALRRRGYRAVVEALPWGWDAAAAPRVDPDAERDIDVLLVGDRNAETARTEQVLLRLARCGTRAVADLDDPGWPALARRARIVLERSGHGEAGTSAFAAAAAGACVLHERRNPTLPTILRPELDYATYGDDDLEEVIGELLANDLRRRAIAAAGQAALVAHRTEDHLRATVAELAAMMGRAPLRRRPGHAEAARVIAEQHRLVAGTEIAAA